MTREQRLAEIANYFKAHEGVVSHLYLDTVGLVTCGIGFLLEAPDECAALGFVRKDGLIPTRQEKRDEWSTVKALEKGHVASYYEPHCKLILPDAAIDAEFARIVDGFEGLLRLRWPRFDTFPESAQLGLLDMIYSMGSGFIRKYPRLCAAVDIGDWKTCAEECGRRNVSASRNSDCAALFTAACALPGNPLPILS